MARATGPRKVHRSAAECKLKAVKLSELDGVQVQDVAEALELPSGEQPRPQRLPSPSEPPDDASS